MTEQLATNQDTLSDDAAESYLEFYLKSIGANEAIETIPPYDRRIMADIPLIVQLEPLHVPEISRSSRDKLVAYFEANNWLPKQLQEANIAAIKGPDETLRRARNSSNRDPIEAQVDTLATLKRYYNDALKDVRTLNTVRTPSEVYTIEPDIDLLRNDREALYTLADLCLSREFLDEAQWPNSNWKQYKERQQYWRGFMLYAGKYASGPVLAEAFNHFFEKVQQRRKYWSEKYGEIDRKIGFLVTQETKAPDEKRQLDEKPVPVSEPLPKAKRIEVSSFDELIPEGVEDDLSRLIAEYADRSAQIDRYVQDHGMRYPEAEIRVLGGRAERYQGHIIGVEAKEDRPSLNSAKTSKPRSSPALSPWIRRQPGYDKRPDK